VLDAQGVVTAVNNAWKRFATENGAGEAARDPAGRHYLPACEGALLPSGGVADDARRGILSILDGSRNYFAMEYAYHAPHEQRWYAMTVLPLAGARGGALVAHANVTERKRAELALAETEERFATLFRSSPIAHALLRADSGRYVEVNEAWERTFGCPRADAIGRSSVEVGVWASEDDHRAFAQRFAASGRVRGERSRRRRSGGEIFEAIVSAEPVELAGVRYRLTSIMDISAEARALDALTRSEARFSALFRSMPIPIALVDLEADRYVDVNEAWESTFKHQREDVVGKAPEAVILWSGGEARSTFLRGLRRRSAVQGFAVTLRDAAGAPLKARVFSVRVEIGGRAHALTSSVDFTAETKAIEQVRRLNAELERRVAERTGKLEAALAELESFSYSVSHDLRAPARAVAGFSRIVMDDHGAELPEEGRRLLARITRAGETMGAMVDGLLELSRISREEFDFRPVDLAELAAEVWRDLAAAEPGRTVELHLAPELHAEGDPVLLRNLLLNLLGNARKYTRGRPDAAAWFGCTREGEYFVRDNGVGFDMAFADRLFGAFQRLHSEREFEGHGIGLALCRRIVERHGGRIRAEAEPDKGAVFLFTLAGRSQPPSDSEI
jgi:PAS domain S-box-containing protein